MLRLGHLMTSFTQAIQFCGLLGLGTWELKGMLWGLCKTVMLSMMRVWHLHKRKGLTRSHQVLKNHANNTTVWHILALWHSSSSDVASSAQLNQVQERVVWQALLSDAAQVLETERIVISRSSMLSREVDTSTDNCTITFHLVDAHR